jgi:hypothetical protein
MAQAFCQVFERSSTTLRDDKNLKKNITQFLFVYGFFYPVGDVELVTGVTIIYYASGALPEHV